MKLQYYKGNNFGDALNPFIFNKFLPGYFDDDDSEIFYGIGTILGFGNRTASKKIVFSSGYAFGNDLTYGTAPIIDNTYDILCVRGPLTAEILKIDKGLAITDGAALLKYFNFNPVEKKHKISYMPHFGSEKYFDWKMLCEGIGFNYISPSEDILKVINEIQASELLISEAMHGAIVADTLRTPWIPFKAYNDINEFKWMDWSKSLNINFKTNYAPSVYSASFYTEIIKNKTKMPHVISSVGGRILNAYQNFSKIKDVIKALESAKNKEQFLSNESLLNNKCEQLIEALELFKKKYPKISK
jgi:succinoglycan biosynthesis protein ExoV